MLALVAFVLVSSAAVGAAVIWESLRVDGSVGIVEAPTSAAAWSIDLGGSTVLWFDDIQAGQESTPITATLTNVSDVPRALSASLETTNPDISLKVYTAAGAPFSSQVVNPGEQLTVKLAVQASPTAAPTYEWFTVVFPP